ncbi:MAG: zf-HC2 domain-containing protein [Acidobacteria bacterium]|nr:MAG: zf-HC2 domain-containing protein [Acidobacteriota bacterium]REJ97959.1 MAG: zf-HC2 domain-containing protein [Acidobacteriota bacterium]REK16702.1 MAG: zf-HC2 domain-containing protein [Acidobacteriota bacterium]REK42613.1 MAG: zf-HC2 domain-containing protein [Acidobacteriota bacterium]
MSDSVGRDLTFYERYKVWLHSLICDACVRYLDQIRLLHIETGRFAPGEPSARLTEDAKARIREKFRDH